MKGGTVSRLCKIICDDPEKDTRVVAYTDRYAADRHGELFFLSIGGEPMAGRVALGALASRCRPLGRKRHNLWISDRWKEWEVYGVAGVSKPHSQLYTRCVQPSEDRIESRDTIAQVH